MLKSFDRLAAEQYEALRRTGCVGAAQNLMDELSEEGAWWKGLPFSTRERLRSFLLYMGYLVWRVPFKRLGLPKGEREATNASAQSVDNRFYERFGFFIGRNALQRADLIDQILEDAIHIQKSWKALAVPAVHLLNANVLELALDPGIIAAVKRIFATESVRLANATLHCKPPGAVKTPWHVDGADRRVARVWVSLSKTRQENGCLRIAPTSQAIIDGRFFDDFYAHRNIHRYNLTRSELRDFIASLVKLRASRRETPELAVGRFFATGYAAFLRHYHNTLRERRAESGFRSLSILKIETDPGDLVVFSPALLHSAYDNRSDSWRVAVGLFYAIAENETDHFGDLERVPNYGQDVVEHFQNLGIRANSHIHICGTRHAGALDVDLLKRSLAEWPGSARFTARVQE
jgi:ectoine hydroxylase-related dioxygenase (phytanoyl-CoA dioxygenase family)